MSYLRCACWNLPFPEPRSVPREAKLGEKNCGFLKDVAGWKVLSVTKPTAMTSISWKSNLNGCAGVVKVLTGGLRRPRRRLSEKPHARRLVKSGEKLRGFHDGGNAFINPCAFVPLPGKVKRGNPGCARVVEGIAEAEIELERTRRPLGQKEEMQHA